MDEAWQRARKIIIDRRDALNAIAEELIKVENNKIISKSFAVRNEEFKSDEEIDKFFSNGRWKKFVIFSMVKYVDLETLSVFYRIRYADITEKYEERDGKINAILQ